MQLTVIENAHIYCIKHGSKSTFAILFAGDSGSQKRRPHCRSDREFSSRDQEINSQQHRSSLSSDREFSPSDVSVDQVSWPLGDSSSISSLSLHQICRPPSSRALEFSPHNREINGLQHRLPSSSSRELSTPDRSDNEVSWPLGDSSCAPALSLHQIGNSRPPSSRAQDTSPHDREINSLQLRPPSSSDREFSSRDQEINSQHRRPPTVAQEFSQPDREIRRPPSSSDREFSSRHSRDQETNSQHRRPPPTVAQEFSQPDGVISHQQPRPPSSSRAAVSQHTHVSALPESGEGLNECIIIW
jgi:hypothetical protein